MSKKLEDLNPLFLRLAKPAYDEMNSDKRLKDLGVSKVVVSESKRELATQMAYYSRSRMSVNDVKKMYKAAGLYEISDQEARIANTWTLASKHLDGLAVDFVPCDINGNLWWSAPKKVFDIMGEIGENCGLKWGGRWDTPDVYHFEQE